jgi:hypothetical protein
VLSNLLDQYRTAREERFATTTGRDQAAAGLLVVALQQRLLSSIEAFARTLKRHRDTVQRQWDARERPALGGSDLFAAAPGPDDERAELIEAGLKSIATHGASPQR